MSVTPFPPEHSCPGPRTSHQWPRVVIAIVIIALVVYAMAIGYEAMAAAATATAAGFGALAVSRRLAL
ncbi:MAG TPA: hypothetical protein VK054_03845 [Beutenbergiaceae bacterium]|nr:hypothetical protein [Beutenbergiaceae bacterium]